GFAIFNRERTEFSRFQHFSICEVSGKCECRRRGKEEISKPPQRHLSASTPLPETNGRKRARNLSQMFRLRSKRPGGLQRRENNAESAHCRREPRFFDGHCLHTR